MVPGPSAVTAAVSASGLGGGGGFVFLGFPPRSPGRLRRTVTAALELGLPVVLFEAANRLARTLELIEPLAATRPVVVARELTKVHETLHRGTARELAEEFRRQPPRGGVHRRDRDMSSTYYVTAAIDYVNGDPHLGHVYEKVGCDVLARHRRLRGDEVRFTVGTDEHSQSVLRAARDAGGDPRGLRGRPGRAVPRPLRRRWTSPTPPSSAPAGRPTGAAPSG